MLPAGASISCASDHGLVADETLEDMDYDYASAMANAARDLMARHAIPPTPDNFGVWFQYVRGTDPAFNKTIDTIISNHRSFDGTINAALSQAVRHLQNKDIATNRMVAEKLHTILGEATSCLATASRDSLDHAGRLGRVATQIESGLDPLAIIAALASELSKAAQRATVLEEKFVETSKELDQVRASLEVAERSSRTDALTGLANRRAFDEVLRVAQIKAMECGEALSIMLLDVDHFKRFNDSFGHQLGDHVLRLIAGVLARTIRTDDFAARYGGEELAAILPGADLSTAEKIAERVRTSISERQIVRRATGQVLAKVTVSIGIAQFAFGETTATLFERCDRALYVAKHDGRNCTRSAEQADATIDIGLLAAAG